MTKKDSSTIFEDLITISNCYYNSSVKIKSIDEIIRILTKEKNRIEEK